MPLKLIAGVSKKLGFPGYSSVGAICHVELELDSGLIQEDPEAFRAQVREVYAQCAESVDEELARHQAPRNPARRRPRNARRGTRRGQRFRPCQWQSPTATVMPTERRRQRQRPRQRPLAEPQQRQGPLPAVGPPVGICPGAGGPGWHGCRANRRALSAAVRKAPRRAFRRRGQRADPRLAGNAGRLAGAGRRLSPRGRVTRIRGLADPQGCRPGCHLQTVAPAEEPAPAVSGRRRFCHHVPGI